MEVGWGDRRALACAEDQVVVLPCRPHGDALLRLDGSVLPQGRDRRGRQGKSAARCGGLRIGDRESSLQVPVKAAHNARRPGLKIHVSPAERQEFTLPCTSGDGEDVQRLKAVPTSSRQQLFNLLSREGQMPI